MSQDKAAAALKALAELAAIYAAAVARLLQVWMADVQKVQQLQRVEQRRAEIQHVIVGTGCTHKQLEAAAGDITAAAVQAPRDAGVGSVGRWFRRLRHCSLKLWGR